MRWQMGDDKGVPPKQATRCISMANRPSTSAKGRQDKAMRTTVVAMEVKTLQMRLYKVLVDRC